MSVTSSVPQGSDLGPLIINDLPDNVVSLKSLLMTLNCTSRMSIMKLHDLHNLCKHFVHGLILGNYLLLITSALSFHLGLKAIYCPHLTHFLVFPCNLYRL